MSNDTLRAAPAGEPHPAYVDHAPLARLLHARMSLPQIRCDLASPGIVAVIGDDESQVAELLSRTLANLPSVRVDASAYASWDTLSRELLRALGAPTDDLALLGGLLEARQPVIVIDNPTGLDSVGAAQLASWVEDRTLRRAVVLSGTYAVQCLDRDPALLRSHTRTVNAGLVPDLAR